MLGSINSTGRRPILVGGPKSRQQIGSNKCKCFHASAFSNLGDKKGKFSIGSEHTVQWLISETISFVNDIVKMIVPAFIGKKTRLGTGINLSRNKPDSSARYTSPLRKGGVSPLNGQTPLNQNHVGLPNKKCNGWVLPPTVYGNTAGLGVFVSPSLQKVLRIALKDPIVRKLFETAKQKGLVSITVEPSLQDEARPVKADEVRDLRTGESRIRIANAGDRFVLASLVHELVHAATPENLNSQVEEYYAENIGRSIYRHITGDTTLAMKPFSNISQIYAFLPEDNHIRQDLLKM
jgi:hypothetical protein